MKDGLYIGEVSKLLDISRDTLRYFDKEGIAVAKKADNNYRYYDDWDINFLIEYKKFRNFDFNVQDTKDILHKDSVDDLITKFSANTKVLEERVKRDQLILQENERYLKRLIELKSKVNLFKITDMVQIKYFQMRYNNTYLKQNDINEMFSIWSKYFPLVEPILVINNPDDGNYECALSIPDRYQDILHLPENHLVKKTKKTKAINTVIVAGEKNTFSTSLLNPACEYIKKMGYTINGPVIGYYTARVHEDNHYKRYIEIFIPIM